MQKKCPKCGQKYGKRKKAKSNHHVYPRGVFGVVGNNYTEELCRNCHDELHELIRSMEKRLLQKCKHAYHALFIEFMASA